MWIDTHCHIQAEEYDTDRLAVLQRARQNGVEKIILSVENIDDSRNALAFACEHPDVYCAVGVHPQQADSWHNNSYQELLTLVQEHRRMQIANHDHVRIVAIGEIGLDYYYENSPREVQKEVYRQQIELAKELDLPIIIHERDAFADSYQILQQAQQEGLLRQPLPGVAHCFSGSLESAGLLWKLGFYLGFDGPLTFKNARHAPQIVENMPLDHLLLETDSPYLTPEPFRGKRNEPAHVVYVGRKAASLRGLSERELAEQTTANAKRLFGF